MFFSKAQSSDSLKTENKVTFSAYAELFYTYDFNEPGNHMRQNFLYSYNRHNEMNLNLGLVKANFQSENIRANLALMAGTYAQDNMVAEQNALRYVNEANVGIRLSKNKNLWIDAGIMPSHIGWESAIGKDNVNLTRSLAAEKRRAKNQWSQNYADYYRVYRIPGVYRDILRGITGAQSDRYPNCIITYYFPVPRPQPAAGAQQNCHTTKRT